MDLLQQARAEIDTVDAEMAALFERHHSCMAVTLIVHARVPQAEA